MGSAVVKIARHPIAAAYLTSLLAVVSSLLTNLWLMRALAREIDTDSFGLFAFAQQVTSYLAILQMSLDFAVSRQIAEALGRHDHAAANVALIALRRFNRWASLLCLGATIAAAGFVLHTVNGYERSRLCAEIVLFFGAAQAFMFMSRPASAALVGSQLMALTNTVTVGTSIATTLAAYMLLRAGAGILCVPVASMLTQAVAWGTLEKLARRRCIWRQLNVVAGARKQLRELWQYGILTAMGGFAWTVESTCDVFILQGLLGTEAVAAYVLWWRFPQLVYAACSNLASSAFPSFANRLGDSSEDSSQLVAKVFWLSLGVATMALIGIGLWLPAFMDLWVGEKYALEDSWKVAASMGLLVWIRTMGNIVSTVWMARGRVKLTTVTCWIQAGLKLVLGTWFVAHHGIIGIVEASCCTMLIQLGLFGVLLCREQMISPALGIKAIALSVVAAGVVWLMAGRYSAVTLSWFAVGVIVTVGIWGGIWAAVAWTGELRPTLRHWLRLQPAGK